MALKQNGKWREVAIGTIPEDKYNSIFRKGKEKKDAKPTKKTSGARDPKKNSK